MGTLDLLLKRMPRNTKTDKKSKKAKRRYSRGVKGIREYRNWVKHTGTINALAPVANMTRQIASEIIPDVRITGKALAGLHNGLESFMHELLRRSKNLSAHQKKVQTTGNDIAFAFANMHRA